MHLIETIFVKIRMKPELLEHVVTRGAGGQINEFFMFTTVAANVNDPDTTGTRARRAAVECFKLVQDLDLSAFIADTTSFCADVAMGLDAAYSAVLQLGAQRLAEAEQFGTADYLRHHVQFLSEIGQHLHQPVVVGELVKQLEKCFFLPVVCKAIVATQDPAVDNFGLELCRFLLQQLGPSPILTRLCQCLLGEEVEVEVEGEASGHEVRRVLLGHLGGTDKAKMQSTLQLLDILLNTREPAVISNLLLRNMPALPANRLGTVDLRSKLVVLLGEEHVGEKALKDYHEEAEHQLYKWESYRSDDIYQTVEPVEEEEARVGEAVIYEGSFLRAVLDLLTHVLALDVDTAVVLTGIVTRLAMCPDPRLHSFLLDTSTIDPVGAKALPNIIFSVSENGQIMHAAIPDATRMIEAARSADPYAARQSDEVSTKVQILLVWQEFLKELVAVIEMKNMLFPNLP